MKIALLLLACSGCFAQGWTQLTNTAIKVDNTHSVCPVNNPAGSPPSSDYLDLCYTKIDAWGGAVADTKRGRLVLLDGGGHAASPGNESYSLDLVTVSSSSATGCTTNPGNTCSTNVAVPTMTRITDPSVWTDCFPSHTPNADGSPWASHQYGSLVYLPRADRYTTWMGGCYSQGFDTRLMLFNPNTKTWTDTGYSGTVSGGDGAYCVLDPTQAQESIICVMGSGGATVRDLVRYNAVTNTATTLLTPATHWQDGPGVVADPDRGLLYVFGNDFAGTPSTNAKLFITNLLDGSYTTTDATSTLTGCDDLLKNPFPGVQWDTSIHKVVGYVPRRQITSSSSVAVGTGTKTFTVASGLTWIASGAKFVAEDAGAYGSNEMFGTVTSYSGTTLTVSISSTSGSGTISNWILNIQYNTIVIFDPATRTCVVHPSSSGSSGPTPDDAMLSLGRGMFGRFGYFPALGEYAVIVSYSTDAYTFKLNNTPTNGIGSSTLYCLDRDGDGYGTGAVKIGTFTDLVIDGSNNKIVSSASHSFTSADLNKPISISAGTGFTVFDDPIVSVAAGKATLLTAAGTVSSTGGTWTINGCTGPDADDLDSAVHTSAQFISKWGDVPTGLKHEGYGPANIWYVSPTGNDGTGVVNDAAHPFLTCCGGGKANPAAGDAVMYRAGTYASFFDTATIGTAGNPTYHLAYPGETPVFPPSSGIVVGNAKYHIIDGLAFNNSGGTADLGYNDSTATEVRHVYAIGDEWQIVAAQMQDMTIEDSTLGFNWSGGCGSNQHAVYLTNHTPGTPSANVFVRRNLLAESCYNGLQMNGQFTNAVVEQNISYGNDVGGIAFLSGVSNSAVRENLSFGNNQTAFNFFNYPDFCAVYDPTVIGLSCPYGQVNNVIENNTFYSTGASPINGDPSTSSPSIAVTNSPDYALSGTSFTIGTGSKAFTISSWSSGATYQGNDIIIFSSNFYVALDTNTNKQPDMNLGTDWNLIHATNVTPLWSNNDRIRVCPNLGTGSACSNTTTNWMEGLVTNASTTSVTITMDTVAGSGTFSSWVVNLATIGNLGLNTFRNNILVSYSQGSGGTGFPQFRYDSTVYQTTSTYQNNVFYNLTPTAGTFTNVIQTVALGVTTYYTCAQAVAVSGSTFGTFANCTNANPQFTASSPSFWNTPSSFNFLPATGSPALSAGAAPTFPRFDIYGNALAETTPSAGGIEGPNVNPGGIGSGISGKVTISGSAVIR